MSSTRNESLLMIHNLTEFQHVKSIAVYLKSQIVFANDLAFPADLLAEQLVHTAPDRAYDLIILHGEYVAHLE